MIEATINFLEFGEIEKGEKFIMIFTGFRGERERLDSKKQIHIKTSESDPTGVSNAVNLADGQEVGVSLKTPVIRITFDPDPHDLD